MRRPRPLLVLAIVTAVAASAPVAFADLESDKADVDSRIEQLQDQIAEAKQREDVLTSDIAAASEQVEAIQSRVDGLSARVATLERELAGHRARLAELQARYAEETRRLRFLLHNERVAEERLAQRIVDLYTSHQPDQIEVLLSVDSLDALIDGLEYLDDIARQDQQLAASVASARAELAEQRRATRKTKEEQAKATAALAERTAERRAALAEIVSRRDELVAAQADREALLAGIGAHREEAEENLQELERASAQLENQIRAAASTIGSSGAGAAPSGGFAWPVNGPVTSGYGQRWGRLHAGIDIGAGSGTPIGAAAAGTVIYSGWLGGYGNLVAIDHGNGISTAYAHQQAIYVSVGQQVGQGETIGEVGNTGNSFGPHLHFEVRINGSAVDPLAYL
jgi:murein DD-endopeptidase MepM/ murein hydrolase activator NlpD